MRTYEFALVLTEAAGKDGKKFTQELLNKVKGKIKDSQVIGIRNLAYPVKKQLKGWYGFFVVELDEAEITELDKQIKIKEEILRYLLLKKG